MITDNKENNNCNYCNRTPSIIIIINNCNYIFIKKKDPLLFYNKKDKDIISFEIQFRCI